MAAPTINITEPIGLTNVTNAESTTNFAGFRHSGGGTPSPTNEVDIFVQGTQAVSIKTSGTARNEGVWYTNVGSTDLTGDANKHVYIWAAITTVSQHSTISGGGIYIIVGSSTSDWNKYFVGGSDVSDSRFVRYVLDITKTPSEVGGSGATLTAVTHIGIGVKGTITAKAENVILDRIDYGTGLQIEDGDSTTPCSWEELFAADNNTTNKYGIIEKRSGIYFLKGGLQIGDGSGTKTSLWLDTTGAQVQFEDPRYHNGSALVSSIDASVLYKINLIGNSTGTTDITFGTVVGSGDDRQGILGGTIGSAGPSFLIDGETDIADLDTVNFYGVNFVGAGNILLSSSTKTDVIGCSFVACDEIQPNTAEFLNNTIIAPVPDRGIEVVASHNIKQVTFVAGTTADVAAAMVWQVDTGVIPTDYIDRTATFNSAATGDCVPFPTSEAIGDYFAMGHRSKYAKLRIDTGTARSGGTLVWEYRTASGWSTLSVTDGTNTLSTTGLQDVTFTPPTDWATTSLEDETPLFYVRLRVTATMTTNPILDQGFIADITEHGLHVPATGTYSAPDLQFFGYGAAGAPKWMGENSSAGLVTLSGTGTTNIVVGEVHATGGGSNAVVNNKSITFTGLIAGSEVRVFLTGTATEVDGVESSGTSFSFDVGSGTAVDYVILGPLANPRVPIRVENISWTADTTIVVKQLVNRNFLNP